VRKAYILIEPPSRVLSTHICESEEEIDKIFSLAEKKQCLLYYANVSKSNNRIFVDQPLELVMDTLQNVVKKRDQLDIKEVIDSGDNLTCPYCNKKMSSTSGLTNHINAKHSNEEI